MWYKRVVKQYELGIFWKHGQTLGLAKPGKYRLALFWGRSIEKFDARSQALRISGQEVILADRTSLKLNVAGSYRIVDPIALITHVKQSDLQEYLNNVVQLRVRDVVAEATLETIFEARNDLNKQLQALLVAEFQTVGLELAEVKIKDVILPSELRSAYVESAAAAQRSKAQLEYARGQSAALRNLANSADLLDKHPQLVQLLLIQKSDKAMQSLNLHFDQPKK